MKIQCDVCQKEEAIVFCAADEAALCRNCDKRVHHANKLAGKHHRFSLHNAAKDDTRSGGPLCDICQERRAFLFCKEDRAILCRECDIPIHTATEHTRNHTRFLLTGVKLSASSSIYPSSSDSSCQDTITAAARSSSSSMSPRHITGNNYTTTTTSAQSRPVTAVSHYSNAMMMNNGTGTAASCFDQSPSSVGGGQYYNNANQQVVGSDSSISTTNNDYYYHNNHHLAAANTTTNDYYTTSSCEMVPSYTGWNDVLVDELFDSSSHFFGYDKNVAESAYSQW